MPKRRAPRALARAASLGALGVALSVGCSSPVGSDPAAGDGPAAPRVGEPDGVHLDESTACAELRDGLAKAAARLACEGVALPECPTLLRALARDACWDWDRGSIADCAAYGASSASCAEIDARRCAPTFFPDRTGSSCAPDDGGVDASVAPDAPDASGD